MLEKPPGDCIFKPDNFVETSWAQGLILLAGSGISCQFMAGVSLDHLFTLQAALSSVQSRRRCDVLPKHTVLSFVHLYVRGIHFWYIWFQESYPNACFSSFNTQLSCKGNFKSMALVILVFTHVSCKDDFFTRKEQNVLLAEFIQVQRDKMSFSLEDCGGNIITITIHLCLIENPSYFFL